MFEKLYNEIVETSDESKGRPMLVSVLSVYYMLNPFLYLFSISQDKAFLNFGVQDWRFALLYCVGAPVLGFLMWTHRVRTDIALFAFLGFEVIRGGRHGYWDAVLLGVAILLIVIRGRVHAYLSSHQQEIHR